MIAPAARAQVTAAPSLPDDTPLDKLPRNTILVLQGDVALDNPLADGWRDSSELKREWNVTLRSQAPNLKRGTAFALTAAYVTSRTFSLGFADLWLEGESSSIGTLTAGAFNRRLGHMFRLDALDPYAGLDAAVVADLLTAKIAKAIAEGKEHTVLSEFERLEKLVPSLPEAAHYYYAKALVAARRAPEGMQRANAYLKKYGPKGKYYRQTIELLSAS